MYHIYKIISCTILTINDNERRILSFSNFRIWDEDENKADVDTYVVQEKGIENLVYNEIMKMMPLYFIKI